MGKRVLIAFVSLLVFSTGAKAQLEAGGFLGTCIYQGDITNNFIGKANFGIGGHLRYNITPYIAARVGLSYGRISGDDKLAKNIDRKLRNLNFKSPIAEFSLVGEYNIFGYNSGSRRRYPGVVKSKWSPYAFGGIALFMFNPTTTYNGKNIQLNTVVTEVGKSYGLIQMAIPVGVGIKYNFVRFWTIGVELGYRKTFTDYLDDVSGQSMNMFPFLVDAEALALSDRSVELSTTGTSAFPTGFKRGDPSDLDSYAFIGVTVSRDIGKTYGRRRR